MYESICLSLFLITPHSVSISTEKALATCIEVAAMADAYGESPVLLISLAMVESNMNPDAIGKDGEEGPLQALRRYHCEEIGNQPCDMVRAGVEAFRGLYKASRRHKGGHRLTHAICMYNMGYNYTGSGCQHALSVLALERQIQWRRKRRTF